MYASDSRALARPLPPYPQLQINFNLSFLDLSCEFLSVDALDILGSNRVNITGESRHPRSSMRSYSPCLFLWHLVVSHLDIPYLHARASEILQWRVLETEQSCEVQVDRVLGRAGLEKSWLYP